MTHVPETIQKMSPTPAQKRAARLFAVQAAYRMILSGDPAGQVVDDMAADRLGGGDPDLTGMEIPSSDLLRAIAQGVERQRTELQEVITKCLKEGQTAQALADKDPLILSILLCGAYELMAHMDIDAPIIINDYLDVTHSYYMGNESRMVNGILGAIQPLYRAG